MGKTPAQENRGKAAKEGMSHDKMKQDMADDTRREKKLANKDVDFGRESGLAKKQQIMAQRIKDMNDPTTDLGKATAKAAKKAAKEAEDFILRSKGISIKQGEVPEGVDPKTILCEYFRYGACAKTGEKCKFSHKMDIAATKKGPAADAKRNIYADDEEDANDTMELWDQAKLEAVIARKHGKESPNATAIVCKHFLTAVEARKYGWFWQCAGGDECRYKHKLPKDYVFKSDLVAMMREVALSKKTDQDQLREALAELKAQGPGTPVTADVFLKWKTEKVETRLANDAKAKEERQKKGSFTGRELCESGEVTNATDEGEDADGDEMKELLRLKKAADEEEEARVTAEATAAMEKAKSSGMTYGYTEYDYGGGMTMDGEGGAGDDDDEDDDEDEEEDGEEKLDEDGNPMPKAVIKRINRSKGKAPEEGEEEEEGEGKAAVGASKPKKAGAGGAVPKKLAGKGFDDKVEFEANEKEPDVITQLMGEDAVIDPKELGRLLAEKKAKEDAERSSIVDKITKDKEEKEARKEAKKLETDAKRAAKKASKGSKLNLLDGEDGEEITTLEQAMKGVDIAQNEADAVASGAIRASALKRTVTGVLASRPTSRDIKITNFSMGMNGRELIKDCDIELTIGRRYGLLGHNGSGKTNFLECLANREVPIPDHIDLYHLREEAVPTDRSALQTVVDELANELKRLQKLEQHIMETVGPDDERLESIYDRLDEIDPNTFETRAAELLHALGFEQAMIHKATKDMSGGWRMRVALAKALFAEPTLLLLDEPTNHLDLEACVWLEGYLAKYKKCLILVSHSQDFLNGVCTHIIWLTNGQLTYYTGNYDTYVKTVSDNEVVQMKKYEKEQADIKHLKEFISSCGTYANARKQAESKQKIIDKMVAAGLTQAIVHERSFTFKFPDCAKVPPPVLPFNNVSFAYSGLKKDFLYANLELGIDCDSRIALVGPNGAGKSTLLKLMTGELEPTVGSVVRHPALVIGKYHQHSVEVLDKNKQVLEFFMYTYPNAGTFKRDLDEWRGYLGRYGVSGKMQTTLIGELSEGQQSRLVFAMICMQKPNMLLLDEPTNHLDLECIDTLAEAINAFNGGLVLVSHDFRLIDQVAKQIWVCEDKNVKIWNDDIRAYKKHLITRAEREAAAKKI